MAFAVFVNGPALLPGRFAPYPLVRWGDVLDLFTPIVLLPLYWGLFRLGRRDAPPRGHTLAFVALAALWTEGQGIHLAANSIGHQLTDVPGSPAAQLSYAYDEVLSHYFWHAAIMGLSLLLLAQAGLASRPAPRATSWPTFAAGVLHGFTFFVIVDEGQTVPLSLPFAALVVGWGLLRARRKEPRHPVGRFFLVAYATALALLVGWGLFWGGYPEFSTLGWIA